ncbi:hypothetical protein [Vibrio campbellii]|uniref:hypothetical protein n=1 Tax=Vibrio campbellii TaxID=680 RepID=UPI003D6A9648
MRIEELDLNIDELLQGFVEEHGILLEQNNSEQSISSQLARKFAEFADGWDVDCEYSRNMGVIKRLNYAIDPDSEVISRNVVPDIIIHRRGTRENLLAVEIKKVCNGENRYKDHAKLAAFKSQLGYRHTLFIDFLTGDDGVGVHSVVLR